MCSGVEFICNCVKGARDNDSSPRRGRLIQPLYYTSTRVGRHSIRVRFYDDLLRGPSELRFILPFMFPRDEVSLITNSSFAIASMVVEGIV